MTVHSLNFANMELRVARHTGDLKKMIGFYTSNLGMEVLGSFEDHDGYNGVFLGMKNESWHLEFTEDSVEPDHHPDEDDLLVFYFSNEEERYMVRQNFMKSGIVESVPKNPYWQQNGILFKDPDGYGIILAVK